MPICEVDISPLMTNTNAKMSTLLAKIRATDPRRPSQSDVATAIGTSQSYYSKLERGDVRVPTDLAPLLAAYFQQRISVIQILYPEQYAELEVQP